MIEQATLETIGAAIALVGALFFLASAIGLVRLPDVYTRVHAPTKAGTLGLILLAAGSLVGSLLREPIAAIEDLLLIAFVCLTMPVSAQVLIRAARRRGCAYDARTRGQPPPAVDDED